MRFSTENQDLISNIHIVFSLLFRVIHENFHRPRCGNCNFKFERNIVYRCDSLSLHHTHVRFIELQNQLFKESVKWWHDSNLRITAEYKSVELIIQLYVP